MAGQQYPPPGGPQYQPAQYQPAQYPPAQYQPAQYPAAGGPQYPPGQYPAAGPQQYDMDAVLGLSSAARRAKERTKARAQGVVMAALEPGEQMLTGARTHTGASDWLRIVPYLAIIATLTQRHYFMVVTDRRVIMCRLSVWTGRPRNVKFAVPRSQVRVSDADLTGLFPKFRFGCPQYPSPIWLRSRGYWIPELAQMLDLLGGPGTAQPGAQQPAYQQYPAQQQYPAPPQHPAQQQYPAPQQYPAQPPSSYQQPGRQDWR